MSEPSLKGSKRSDEDLLREGGYDHEPRDHRAIRVDIDPVALSRLIHAGLVRWSDCSSVYPNDPRNVLLDRAIRSVASSLEDALLPWDEIIDKRTMGAQVDDP